MYIEPGQIVWGVYIAIGMITCVALGTLTYLLERSESQ